jgi:Na+/melibiose symporter-like transporter
MDILAIYLAASIVIILFIVLVLIGYGSSHKEPEIVGVGVGLGFLAILLFWFSVEEYHEPKAIEVYQGKTTLEYTIKDNVKIDSVVVYKNKNH